MELNVACFSSAGRGRILSRYCVPPCWARVSCGNVDHVDISGAVMPLQVACRLDEPMNRGWWCSNVREADGVSQEMLEAAGKCAAGWMCALLPGLHGYLPMQACQLPAALPWVSCCMPFSSPTFQGTVGLGIAARYCPCEPSRCMQWLVMWSAASHAATSYPSAMRTCPAGALLMHS
jgi:hypothetical protein